MDEYADDDGVALPETHPESFRHAMKVLLSEIEPALRIPGEQVIFPTSENLKELKSLAAATRIHVCYGGIGIHGHIAFNEPAVGVRHSDPRAVTLNDFTLTINAIRAGVGGDLVNFPYKALTLGMNQIFAADKIRLYCRNDIPGIDWANTVLRLAVLGTPGDDYPVTYIKEHKDWMVFTDRNTAAQPKTILPPLK
jgi:glucosamine-6-phosphate deaminase